MIDIHCHIIAGVDDGAKSWEVAQQMCRMAAADGIEHIVATPHANDRYVYNRDEHRAALEHLRSLIGGSPRLSLGCDFHLSYENVQDALTRPDWYTIDGGKYMLVELSNYGIPHQIEEYFPSWATKEFGRSSLIPSETLFCSRTSSAFSAGWNKAASCR